MEVTLTDLENQICTLLDDCVRDLKNTNGLSTSCRIAGGWVRDKLLGSQSNDIDVAVEDMMGLAFATHLVTFARARGIEATEPAVVKSNPDQSKHLETTKVRVYDMELDLVNLRSEEYAEGSRIPTEVKYGTPLEDALRRDLTINALFYNVHTHSVEDHTGRGLDDLRQGVIRTPLDPEVTFHDDPLRLLRSVRFASRFGFDIAPDLIDAAKRVAERDQELFSKISRERFGEEFHKMMKGRDPLRAIQLIHSLSLYHPTFHLPPAIVSSLSSHPRSPLLSLSAAVILRILLDTSSSLLPSLHPTLLSGIDPPSQARLYMGAALTPFRGITYTDSKKKSHPAAEAVIREGLKLGTQNHYLDGVPLLFASAEMLADPDLSQDRFKIPSERVAIGLLLRDKAVHNPFTGSHWTASLLFSLVQELVPAYDPAEDVLDVDQAGERIQLYNTFVGRIEELDLPSAIDAKPILDGREVVQALGVPKPGVWTGEVLSRVLQWQLEFPAGTKEECTRWLRKEQQAGRIVIDEDSLTKRGKPGGKDTRTKRTKT